MEFSIAINGWKTCYSNNTKMQYRALFGKTSDSRFAGARDGTSNTPAFIETPLMVYNGGGNAGGYRAWVMNGVTLYDNLNNFPMMALYGGPINCWTYGSTASTYLPGRVASWGMSGSLHPAGCNVVMADGSVHFINESTNLTVLTLLCNLADGAAVGEF